VRSVCCAEQLVHHRIAVPLALGRTGTAIRLGRVTMVVDPANGVVLDETNYGSSVMFVTQGPATSEPTCSRPECLR
jgi:hypothetical protein